eukprot:TRINITY_DN18546_c0_g2_i1.p1 TRINITY_DN18546_c0_g2~~TRINITY_DN18546_c0_g2_i1.p1  ORF type:complete len:339 (+),score=70.15 TRINITY_DN18546_c0_g2_i1:194-1210(+)
MENTEDRRSWEEQYAELKDKAISRGSGQSSRWVTDRRFLGLLELPSICEFVRCLLCYAHEFVLLVKTRALNKHSDRQVEALNRKLAHQRQHRGLVKTPELDDELFSAKPDLQAQQAVVDLQFERLSRLYGKLVLELSAFAGCFRDYSIRNFRKQMLASDAAHLWVDRLKFEDLLQFLTCVVGVRIKKRLARKVNQHLESLFRSSAFSNHHRLAPTHTAWGTNMITAPGGARRNPHRTKGLLHVAKALSPGISAVTSSSVPQPRKRVLPRPVLPPAPLPRVMVPGSWGEHTITAHVLAQEIQLRVPNMSTVVHPPPRSYSTPPVLFPRVSLPKRAPREH